MFNSGDYSMYYNGGAVNYGNLHNCYKQKKRGSLNFCDFKETRIVFDNRLYALSKF